MSSPHLLEAAPRSSSYILTALATGPDPGSVPGGGSCHMGVSDGNKELIGANSVLTLTPSPWLRS